MKRFLITGATTPLGREFISACLKDDATEVVLATGIEAPADAWLGHDDPRLEYQQVDLTRRRRLWRLLFGRARELGIEVLVHTATHRTPSASGSHAHALNVDVARTLLSECERHPTIKRLVYRSYAEVYQVDSALADIIDETQPLNFDPSHPQWLRDRVEADLTVCARMGLCALDVAVLRCAECLGPKMGSQLHDYFCSKVCFQPAGYDPMINLLTVEDMANALWLSANSDAIGVFNIPGKDTLPLSEAIHRAGRRRCGVPTPLMRPLYAARRLALGTEFQYQLNHWRFHFNGSLDGRRAAKMLGYEPEVGIDWDALQQGLC